MTSSVTILSAIMITDDNTVFTQNIALKLDNCLHNNNVAKTLVNSKSLS